VGSAFLEENFSGSTAPPEHRFHQKAAQVVLRALLPESGTDIKGQMRSRHELLDASGYANHPSEFDDLIRILDPELRLITPTDPEGSLTEGQRVGTSEQFYQLTHDYLVHSLRDWLTRKQRETRRGRAELVLEDRYALWRQKRVRRHLPVLTEAISVLLFVGFTRLQTDQKAMVKSALIDGAFYLLRNLIIAAILFVVFISTLPAAWIVTGGTGMYVLNVCLLVWGGISLVVGGICTLFMAVCIVYKLLASSLSVLSRVVLAAKE
jgi:hypothetical protein